MRSGIPARVVERVESLADDIALVTVAGVAHVGVAPNPEQSADAFDSATWVVIHMGLSQQAGDSGREPG